MDLYVHISVSKLLLCLYYKEIFNQVTICSGGSRSWKFRHSFLQLTSIYCSSGKISSSLHEEFIRLMITVSSWVSSMNWLFYLEVITITTTSILSLMWSYFCNTFIYPYTSDVFDYYLIQLTVFNNLIVGEHQTLLTYFEFTIYYLWFFFLVFAVNFGLWFFLFLSISCYLI